MEKKRVWKNKYLYFLVSIVLIILIVAEASQIGNYHSSSGSMYANITQSNQDAFVVIAKLPGVSANVAVFLGPTAGYPFGNRTATVPQSNTTALITTSNFNSSNYWPKITVQFNSTSHSMNKVPVIIAGNLNFTLTPSNPVFIQFVTASNHPGLSPSITVTPEYDYLVIQVSSTVLINFNEVSR